MPSTRPTCSITADTSQLKLAIGELTAAVQVLDEAREVIRRRAEGVLAQLREEIAFQGDEPTAKAGDLSLVLTLRPGGQYEQLVAAARALRLQTLNWIAQETSGADSKASGVPA